MDLVSALLGLGLTTSQILSIQHGTEPALAGWVSEIAPRVPVLFMTGCRADNPGIELLRAAGPLSDCLVISKPFTSNELLGDVSGIFSTTPR